MGFERACAAAEVPHDEGFAVVVGGVEVAVARDGDEFFAVHNLCTHAAVALAEGEVADCQIECWLHGSRFDLRSGKPTGPPAVDPVATFPVELRGGDVFIDVTTTLNGVTPG